MKHGRKVHWVGVLDFPKEGNAHISKVERSKKKSHATLHPWRRRDYVPSKRRDQLTPSTQRRVTDEPLPPATNLWEHQISNPSKYLYVLCAKIFSFFRLKQRAQMHEYQDGVRVLRYWKTRYNWTVIFCSGKSVSKLFPQSKLIYEASYLSLPCLVRMLSVWDHFTTLYKYSFILNSYFIIILSRAVFIYCTLTYQQNY